MGGEITLDKGKGKDTKYQIKCIRKTILGKEAKGQHADFERGLLKSWARYEGWEEAGEPFGDTSRTSGKSKSSMDKAI